MDFVDKEAEKLLKRKNREKITPIPHKEGVALQLAAQRKYLIDAAEKGKVGRGNERLTAIALGQEQHIKMLKDSGGSPKKIRDKQGRTKKEQRLDEENK